MATKTRISRIARLTENQAIVAGLIKNAATAPPFVMDGTPMTPADIVAVLQADIAATSAVAPARANWQAAVKAASAQKAKADPLISVVKQFLQLGYASHPSVLADYGQKTRKVRTPLTPEQKAAAVAKAKATRVARGTMGPVQKQRVKGNVVGVTVTPVVTPPPAPAPAGSPVTASPTAASTPETVAPSPAPHAS